MRTQESVRLLLVRDMSGHAVDTLFRRILAPFSRRGAMLAIGTKVALGIDGGPQAVTSRQGRRYREVGWCAGKATDGGGPPVIFPIKIA
jgi:hypothetical protein